MTKIGHNGKPQKNFYVRGASHTVTDYTREAVVRMVEIGLSRPKIAEFFGITIEQLHEFYKAEIGNDWDHTQLAPPWDKATSEAITAMAVAGIHVDIMASIVKLPLEVIKIVYNREIELGLSTANTRVANALLQRALSSTHPRAHDATTFWLTHRAGWRDIRANLNLNAEVESADEVREAMDAAEDPDQASRVYQDMVKNGNGPTSGRGSRTRG